MEDHVAAFLPVRISEALEKYGYETFRSIKYATDEELLLVDNFGEKTLNHLREVVRRIERGELVELPDDPSEVVFERTKT
jgi:DNA-directed RNA polymerase alpha subunit